MDMGLDVALLPTALRALALPQATSPGSWSQGSVCSPMPAGPAPDSPTSPDAGYRQGRSRLSMSKLRGAVKEVQKQTAVTKTKQMLARRSRLSTLRQSVSVAEIKDGAQRQRMWKPKEGWRLALREFYMNEYFQSTITVLIILNFCVNLCQARAAAARAASTRR